MRNIAAAYRIRKSLGECSFGKYGEFWARERISGEIDGETMKKRLAEWFVVVT